MRREVSLFGLLGAFVLVVPSLGTPVQSSTRRSVPEVSPATERVLLQVAEFQPAARAVRTLRQKTQPAAAPQSPAAVAASVPPASAAAPVPPRTHSVQGGDSLWTISQRYGVSVEALASANGLAPQAVLPVGKRLVVPSGGAASASPAAPARATAPATAVHVVQSGQSLWTIASQYGTTVETLMAVNNLSDDRLMPGQRLVVSGRALPRHRQVGQAAVPRQRQARPESPEADVAALRAGGALIWPTQGVITSRFGWRRYRRHHEGIDLAAPRGTPIYAARDGVVDFAGWKGGYGRVVYIDHGGGVVSVYGHASKLLVKTGQPVKKGQVIALVGCTGACTGAHVHFEVRVSGRAVNPLQYLR
ncbi:MAG: peptidoglycan DD-metalloendopeptidase family protein [Armatimonadetes bacterium]|nr:peptidoglycan DD-metalloendopeptidase family protein [Armatimonadota bacterium]